MSKKKTELRASKSKEAGMRVLRKPQNLSSVVELSCTFAAQRRQIVRVCSLYSDIITSENVLKSSLE